MIDTYTSTCDMVNTRLHNDCDVDERPNMYFLVHSECEKHLAVYWKHTPTRWTPENPSVVFREPVSEIITVIDLEEPEVDLTKFLFQHIWDNGPRHSLLAHELQIVDTRDFLEQFHGGDDPIPF